LSKQKTRQPLEDEQTDTSERARARYAYPRRLVTSALVIFLVAFGIRLLAWQDNAREALKVQSAVTEGYKHTGRLLREGGIASFFSASSPLADPSHLGHPPGYSILLAIVSGLTSDADATVRLLQITADALAAVVVFLIAAALLSTSIARIAALLVALAPQFTYNSTLLLPDSLAVLPLLLAVYCLVRATTARRPALAWFIAAGALVGVSCWLRANAMMLAPFMALALPLLFERGRRLLYASLLIGGMLLALAPLTARNYIVHDHFIPVSLGAGQTFLEGIADYDREGRFGIPATDMGIMKMEAELYGRPDYYGMLFNPDGIKRERLRIRMGLRLIAAHPFWFAGVMARRAAGMLRLERVHMISPDPPARQTLSIGEATQPVWSAVPADLLAFGTTDSSLSQISLSQSGQMLLIQADASKYDNQLVSAPFKLQPNTDYLLRVPVRIEQGRMSINVISERSSTPSAAVIIETEDWKTPAEQPLQTIQLPFVSRKGGEARISFANGGSSPVRPLVEVGVIEVYALGPTSGVWLRYPRTFLNLLQRFFITAVMLPLALFGLFPLIGRKQWRTIALLLVVPAYYLCFQSALHTEYRYVMAIHYFLFVLAALALHTAGLFLWRQLLKLPIARRLFRSTKGAAVHQGELLANAED
jgi:hypothetical protein